MMLSLLDGIADLSLRGRTISSTRAAVGKRTPTSLADPERSSAHDPVLAARRWPRIMHIRGVLIGRDVDTYELAKPLDVFAAGRVGSRRGR